MLHVKKRTKARLPLDAFAESPHLSPSLRTRPSVAEMPPRLSLGSFYSCIPPFYSFALFGPEFQNGYRADSERQAS